MRSIILIISLKWICIVIRLPLQGRIKGHANITIFTNFSPAIQNLIGLGHSRVSAFTIYNIIMKFHALKVIYQLNSKSMDEMIIVCFNKAVTEQEWG